MKHLVFMKLIPGAFDDAAERDYRETFAALQSALPDDILAVSVRKNCVARAQNMDVLVEMTLAGEPSLQAYLNHPLHRAIGQRYSDKIVSVASFDYQEERQ